MSKKDLSWIGFMLCGLAYLVYDFNKVLCLGCILTGATCTLASMMTKEPKP